MKAPSVQQSGLVSSFCVFFFLAIHLPSTLSFVGTSTSSSTSSLYSTTETKPMESAISFPEYSEDELRSALFGLLDGSKDPDFDGRHLLGYGDPNHKLSKLQEVTATRILDYERYMVSNGVSDTL
jgi:hypothetical protein